MLVIEGVLEGGAEVGDGFFGLGQVDEVDGDVSCFF